MHDLKFFLFLYPNRPHAHLDDRWTLAELSVIGKDPYGFCGQIRDGKQDFNGNLNVTKILATDATADAATHRDTFEQTGLATSVRRDYECRTAIKAEAKILKTAETLYLDLLEDQHSPARHRLG